MPSPLIPDFVSTWPQAWQLFIALIPIGLLAKWLSYRERHWRFSSRKTKALRKLLEKDAWRKAPPLELQYAFQDAFGRGFDPLDLAFIEKRRRPLMLIQDRLVASRLVQLNEGGTGFERTSTSWTARISLAAWSSIWSAVAWICATLALLLIAYAARQRELLLGVVGLDFLVLAVVMFMGSRMCDAARRVVALEDHGEARELPPKAKKPAAKSTRQGIDVAPGGSST